MTAHTPFDLEDLAASVKLLGHLEFSLDPLNGADDLFFSPGMRETAEKIAHAYTMSAWAPRAIRLSEKAILPKGHIVGLRQPSGQDGPYPEVVFMVTPHDVVPTPSIEILEVIEG